MASPHAKDGEAGQGLFPYNARPHQEAIIGTVRAVVGGTTGGGHLVMESPTGSGKTVCTLVPALEAAFGSARRVIYTTRTNSQQLQVMKELREVVSSSGTQVLGIGIQGRGNMCLLMRDNPDWRDGTPEEISSLCGDLKNVSRSRGGQGGCPYYSGLLASDLGALREWVKDHLPTIEELVRHCDGIGVCPYELAKRLMQEATIVVAPYIFVFHPQIRQRLMEWTRMDPGNTTLLVDEAHNLPEFVRGLQSIELGQVSLRRAEAEARDHGDPELAGGVRATDLLKAIEGVLLDLEKDFMVDDDGMVPTGELMERLMAALRMPSPRLQGLVKELMVHGELIKETRRRAGRLPRSYLSRVSIFLATWSSLEGAAYVRLIRRDRSQATIQAYCMDPTAAGEVLSSMASTVHMSGTLTPLEEYRDSVGLPEGTALASFPSPFPRENLLLVYCDDVTTQYEALQRDQAMLANIRDRIVSISRAVPRNTAIFFPSFDIMNRVAALGLPAALEAIGRRVFVEVQGEQGQLMDMLASYRAASLDPACGGAVLMSVAGGRVSEGMDFPERQLELALVVGIPYPRPTMRQKALQYYYDMRFGKGWDYIVKGPTERKMLQTIGRLVRSETDVGAAVILDARALHFSEKVHGLVLDNDPGPRLAFFFEERSRRAP